MGVERAGEALEVLTSFVGSFERGKPRLCPREQPRSIKEISIISQNQRLNSTVANVRILVPIRQNAVNPISKVGLTSPATETAQARFFPTPIEFVSGRQPKLAKIPYFR